MRASFTNNRTGGPGLLGIYVVRDITGWSFCIGLWWVEFYLDWGKGTDND